MKQKILKLRKKYFGLSMILSAIIGAVLSWIIGWIFPSKKVEVSNLPQKELTCTMDYSYPIIVRKNGDDRFKIMFDGLEITNPYFFSITVLNSGNNSVLNEDFKKSFSVDFSGCKGIVNAQVARSTNSMISDEVLSNSEFNGTVLTITDFFLNPSESFTIYVITDGKPDAIYYGSRIADVGELIIRNKPKETIDQRKWVLYVVLISVIGLALCMIVFLMIWERRSNKKIQELYQKYLDSEIFSKKKNSENNL